MKKLSKKFITIFQPLLENSRFLFNARFFGTKAEELKEFFAQFLSLPPSPVPEDEAVSFPSGVPGAEAVLV